MHFPGRGALMFRGRFTVRRAIALMALLIVSRADRAAAENICSAPIVNSVQVDDPVAAWNEHNDPVITQLEGSSKDLKIYYITGDRLQIDRDRFRDLARNPDSPLTNVEEIIFDGREIVIDMPIHLEAGKITFKGDVVRFTPNGYIAYHGQPKAKGEGLFIQARQIDVTSFGVRNYLPFQFTTSHPSWNGQIRQVSLVAGRIVGPLADLDAKAAREFLFFHSLVPTFLGT
ncbi:hypothetical protein ABIF50_010118 [Bradyrhizobium diazoefficiens]